MTGDYLEQELRRLGLSAEDLALDLGIIPSDVEAWQRSSVPRKQVRRVEWHFAAAERRDALKRSNLPQCEWLERFAASRPPNVDVTKVAAEVAGHQEQCDVCIEHERFLTQTFGPMPQYPLGMGMELLSTVASPLVLSGKIRRVFVLIALSAALLVLSAVIGLLPTFGPAAIIVYFIALGVLVSLGYAIYSILGILHTSPVGRWLARCIAGVIAMLGFLSVIMLSGFSSMLNRRSSPETWPQIIGMGLTMGLLYATLWPLGAILDRTRRRS